jgi:hypothetical protein
VTHCFRETRSFSRGSSSVRCRYHRGIAWKMQARRAAAIAVKTVAAARHKTLNAIYFAAFRKARPGITG